MSLIKSIRKQLGLSVTPANNFTLDASADDGTMKLARGNAGATTQDVMTVDAAGKVAFPQMAQTWQDVTGSRLAATDYTNSTGQPIQVVVSGSSATVWSSIVTIAGVTIAQFGGNNSFGSVTFIVPSGATYRISAFFSNWRWAELR